MPGTADIVIYYPEFRIAVSVIQIRRITNYPVRTSLVCNVYIKYSMTDQ